MTTTSLIVETLIAGLQTLVCLMLYLVLFRGMTWTNISVLKDWISILLLFVVAVAYTLGLLIERTASFIMGFLDTRFAGPRETGEPAAKVPGGNLARIQQFIRLLWKGLPEGQRFAGSEMRMKIMKEDSTLSSYIEGYRHQYRMLAATTLNVFICLALLFLAWGEPGWVSQEPTIKDFVKNQVPVALLILFILFIFIIVHWWHMHRHYQKHVKTAYDFLNSQPGPQET